MTDDGTHAAPLQPEKATSSSLKVASAAHEVKNFAESLTNLVYLLRQNPKLDEDSRKYVQLIESELEHMRDFISQTLARYREIAHPGPVSVSSILDAVLQLYSNKIAANDIQVEKRCEGDDFVKVEAEELREVFSNLVGNALQALQPGGKLILHLYHSWIDAQTQGIRVVVADNGAGIPHEDQSKVFQQSFTTKGEQGNGLGLWMTAKIVHQHGGTIRFRSSTTVGRKGTLFSVFLPSAGNQEPAQRKDGSAGTPMPTNTDVKLPTSPQTRILSPKENRAIARRLHAESHRLLMEIRGYQRRSQFKAKPR